MSDCFEGFLNEITLDLIAPKLPGTTFHILSSVNSGWRQAVESRLVQDMKSVCVTRGRTALTVHEGKQSDEQLIPGIPNEITLNLIVPKLPWTAFHILKSVNSGWRQAIESRQVYDARVRAQSNSNLVVLKHKHSNSVAALSLYSMKDDSCYHLPPIPDRHPGTPESGKCICLEGKVYVLGGTLSPVGIPPNTVYVLDLAGHKQWKRCANMIDRRYDFACGALGGKIYVFGGDHGCTLVGALEVYEPAEDTWSPITHLTLSAAYQEVITVGEELFVYNGHLTACDILPAHVYHPLKDEWRLVENVTPNREEKLLTVGGKLHILDRFGLWVRDFQADSWKPLQSCSFDVLRVTDATIINLSAVEVVDNELLVIVSCPGLRSGGPRLMRSQGLGNETKKIMWQKLKCSFLLFDSQHRVMCPIQL